MELFWLPTEVYGRGGKTTWAGLLWVLGSIQHTPFLRRIGTDNDWISIAVGESHNLALKKDGTIWGWGGDLRDELGNHTNFLRFTGRGQVNQNMSSTPSESVLGNDWKQIAAGMEDSFGIKNDGTLWAWGLNNFGQLGIGNFIETPTPIQIGSSTWSIISAGFINTAGIQSNGSLWVWGGDPAVGNRSPMTNENYCVPVCISSNESWADVSVGFNVVFAIKSDGTLWAWGYRARFYTGANQTMNDNLVQVGTDSDWQQSSSCGSHYLALMKKDGSLWSLNQGTNYSGMAQLKRINLRKDIVAIGEGGIDGGLGAALTRDGEVWTWGDAMGETAPNGAAPTIIST